MNPATAAALRRSAAHALVDDVDDPALDEAGTHHLFRVLRLRDGDPVTVTDGAGRWRGCRATRETLEIDGPVEEVPRRADPITIAVAIPKHDRPEWIVQKLTELGVDRIRLLHAERSVVRWTGERADRHLAKLTRVANEAVQQSRQVWLPTIDGPVGAAEVLGSMAVAEPGGRPLAVGDRAVAIGPEGGWTADEVAAAADAVTLGTTVLRVETAALAAAVRMITHSE